MGEGRWHFWIDRGGTFTDVVARRPDGALTTAKLLSDDPARTEDAAVAAIRQLTGVAAGPLPPADVRMGTTVATNALLERTGAPTLLAITRGFADALTIGTQDRPDIFARAIRLTPPPFAAVAEIDERVAADGRVLTALDEGATRRALQSAKDSGIDSVAIVLMHGWRWTDHERRVAAIARDVGFSQISVSHETSALIKLVGRGDTTLADATLTPVLHRYIDKFRADLGPAIAPLFMQSSGGLADHSRFRGKDAVLSGPAGGIVALAHLAELTGHGRMIGFDMGGTSTDVSHYAGQFERDGETIVAGTRIRANMLRIHTVAAGGGSIIRWDGVRLHVGPESAGAVPGPSAYRRGGPLTVTDCNVMLGKIQPRHFPALFGPAGDEAIDAQGVAAAFTELAARVSADTGQPLSAEQLAEGCIAIAVANMANAIKRISVARGHDVGDGYALACFGGAAGQHACLVADALGMAEVVIHPLAGVLSAYGMGLARESAIAETTLGLALDAPDMAAQLADVCQRLTAQARASLGGAAEPHIATTLFVREAASENCIEIGLESIDAGMAAHVRAAFADAFRVQFGYPPSADLVIDRVLVDALGDAPATSEPHEPGSAPLRAIDAARIYSGGAWHDCPVYAREALGAGAVCGGPALIIDPLSTVMVESGWSAICDATGVLRLTRVTTDSVPEAHPDDAAPDPVRLEIFNALFMAIAEEMGGALQRSASSVNIRERLDFSCALFDGAGRLVANAPHMPVHLGSMGESVRSILRRRGRGPDGRPVDGRGVRRGDAYALNAPYEGGTHLPDITVIMPVFVDDDTADPHFFVAARGHHADIGGISPGSMPPDSRTIHDEGIVLDNILILEDGNFLEADLRTHLTAGPHPSRNPALNIADLKAQIAACVRGAAALRELCARQTPARIAAYMAHGQHQAEMAVRRLIGGLTDGQFRYAMDNGAQVNVTVTVDRASASLTIDFTGTSATLPDNFNAPLPVVRAAVLYVLRTMIDEAIPMNEGCLTPVRIIVPDGTMLSPAYPAAVVAGNVETSQVITDALFGAFGAMAASQGTMNNFTFGNADHQYYETIAGGAGAGPDFDGASAVQTHMTNSRLTDPEILETRFPVIVDRFAIRRGSGGAGRHKGGDGVVRAIRFETAMSAGILANRRATAPFGLAGGGDAAPGINRVVRADGGVETLAATAQVSMAAGDMMVIETPGGGGYGAKEEGD